MRGDLTEWLRFVRAQHHLLRARPACLFQQAANQPDWSGPGRAAELRARAGLERRPWFRWVNKPAYWDPCLVTFEHGGRKGGFAFSPDSRRVIAGWSDASMQVSDAATGRQVVILQKPERSRDERNLTVMGCSFAAEGTRIVTWIEDGTLKLWDAATGDLMATLARHEDRASAWGTSPDGVWVGAAFEDGLMKLWRASTGRMETLALCSLDGLAPHSLTFSRDGARLAALFFHGAVALFETETGRPLQGFATTPALLTLEFSKDGQRLLARHEGQFFAPAVWTLEGEKVAEFSGHRDRVTACAFSPAADRVITASMDGTIKLWAASGEEMLTFRGHTGGVTDCAFSPDGRLVASASRDRTLRLWDADTGRALARFTGHDYGVDACTFSPDGSRIISVGGETTRIWDAAARIDSSAPPDATARIDDDAPLARPFRGRFEIALTDRVLHLTDSHAKTSGCEFGVRDRLVAFTADDAGGVITARDEWGATYVLVPENLA
jgi:WD40 repeat protein